jgi:hypothetical protein
MEVLSFARHSIAFRYSELDQSYNGQMLYKLFFRFLPASYYARPF